MRICRGRVNCVLQWPEAFSSSIRASGPCDAAALFVMLLRYGVALSIIPAALSRRSRPHHDDHPRRCDGLLPAMVSRGGLPRWSPRDGVAPSMMLSVMFFPRRSPRCCLPATESLHDGLSLLESLRAERTDSSRFAIAHCDRRQPASLTKVSRRAPRPRLADFVRFF